MTMEQRDSWPAIPDHELLECVGKGAYGRVYRAVNVIGSARAVKIVERGHFDTQRPYDREFMGIVKYEPLSRGHPNLVSVLHVGRDRSNEYFYYVMDIADDLHHGPDLPDKDYTARSLQSDLEFRGRLPVSECMAVLGQVLDGLDCLHQHRLVHRDIKPANIIFAGGIAKLADVGLVSGVGDGMTYVGSEGYVPPEGPGSFSGDVYAVGKVLYQMLSGSALQRFPEYDDEDFNASDLTISRELISLAERACHADQRRRIHDAQEFRAELDQLARHRKTTPRAGGQVTESQEAMDLSRVVVVGDLDGEEFGELLTRLKRDLMARGVTVFCDDAAAVTVDWARTIERQIAEADAVVALLSDRVVASETLAYELELASSNAEMNEAKPRVIPVLGTIASKVPEAFDQCCRRWGSLKREQLVIDQGLLAQIFKSRPGQSPPSGGTSEANVLETVGGAVPLDSPFYVARQVDEPLYQAIRDQVSIVLLRGARQMGKTSLLARGLQVARQVSHRVIVTDFQKFNRTAFESSERLYLAMANSITEQLDLDQFPEDTWDSRRSPNANLERYLRKAVFDSVEGHIVWGMDEIDQLFGHDFSNEVFGMLRSWHNNRALDPGGRWSRLTLVLAYSTEAHLMVTDLNQSPFNVGTRLALKDFSLDQVSGLEKAYGLGLSEGETESLFHLVQGHPFLTRLALHAVAADGMSLEAILAGATSDDSLFSDHLRRLLLLLARDQELVAGVKEVLTEGRCRSALSLHRLRGAGLVRAGDTARLKLGCELYTQYLKRELLGE